MKRHVFNTLKEFYADCANNVVRSVDIPFREKDDRPDWIGLSLSDLIKYRFSYPIGVEQLNRFKNIEVQKDIRVKFYNQFDGYDIDIDRMYENLDFLIDNRKVRKLPKTMDIYINVMESWRIDYNQLLNKTYAAVKIIDRLETLGVRCAIYAISCFKPSTSKTTRKTRRINTNDTAIIEVCLKNYSESLNLGAVCTGISPWMLRYWMLNWILGHYKGTCMANGIAHPTPVPFGELNGIVIDTQQCLNLTDANNFIETIKIA